MSIKVITLVWDKSEHKGNNLLTLLALADNANDDGYCWPGLDNIAKKTRVSRNTVIRCIKTLEETAELFALHSRRHGNKYLILVGRTDKHIKSALERYYEMSIDEIDSVMIVIKNLRVKCQNDTYQNDTSEVNPSSHESSITVKETSNKLSAGAPDEHRLIKDYTVEIVFNGNTAQYGRAGDIANWAQCRNPKEQWSKYHLDTPFSFEEWRRFLQAYKDKGIDWPSSPEKWNKQAYNWRLSESTQATRPAKHTTDAQSIRAALTGGAT